MYRIMTALILIAFVAGCQTAPHKVNNSATATKQVSNARMVPAISKSIFLKLDQVQIDFLAVAEDKDLDLVLEELVTLQQQCEKDCNSYENAMINNYFAYVYYRKGQMSKAAEYYGKVADESPHSARARATSTYACGKFELSGRKFRECEKLFD